VNIDRPALPVAARGDQDAVMVATSINRIADAVTRRRTRVGNCSTCHGTVFGDERRVTIHGVLVHRRCATYRRRGR
jgi:hypothetical protein